MTPWKLCGFALPRRWRVPAVVLRIRVTLTYCALLCVSFFIKMWLDLWNSKPSAVGIRWPKCWPFNIINDKLLFDGWNHEFMPEEICREYEEGIKSELGLISGRLSLQEAWEKRGRSGPNWRQELKVGGMRQRVGDQSTRLTLTECVCWRAPGYWEEILNWGMFAWFLLNIGQEC